jgi:hypothetical protein
MNKNDSVPPPPPTSQKTGDAPASASTITLKDNTANYRLPDNKTLQHAAKLAVVEDKPIMLDYWTNSLDKSVIIGVKSNNEKLLVKSEEEYTSPISKIFKVEKEYIIMTENSIYIIDTDVQTKRISG